MASQHDRHSNAVVSVRNNDNSQESKRIPSGSLNLLLLGPDTRGSDQSDRIQTWPFKRQVPFKVYRLRAGSSTRRSPEEHISGGRKEYKCTGASPHLVICRDSHTVMSPMPSYENSRIRGILYLEQSSR